MNGTPKQLDVAPNDNPRLFQAAQEYLAELEAGRRPDRAVFVARYPDLADELAPYLDALNLFHANAPLLRASPRSPAADAAGAPVEPLGDYRIVAEIGRGGMGIVYEAVQMSLGRRVALKILPFAAALDGKQLQRFKNEAQAAAHLNHPNIVPVHAIGCERGVHYYAMQLIEGQSLAALIDGLRRSLNRGTTPEPAPTQKDFDSSSAAARNRPADSTGPYPFISSSSSDASQRPTDTAAVAALSTERVTHHRDFFRRVASLGIKAAEALEHAHQLGVVHRDIKPANLLLDVQGNLWITDFGLASVQSNAGLTMSGELLGTLRYMSPEQALGQRELIDHRTDVYALGVTLYELLTLQPVFGGQDRQELLHRIATAEPRPPRDIEPAVPVELETIVLKAISKNSQDRYATAQELADDLRRFLEDRPIRARRPSLAEKATKWARRHRAIVVSGVAALLLSVAGLSVATVLASRAYDRERQKADEEEKQFRLARRSVDEMIAIAEEELADSPQLQNSRRRLLEAALSYYQEFIDQRRPDDLANLQATRDHVQTILGDLAIIRRGWQHLLLAEPAVQEELQLSAAQKKGVSNMLSDISDRRPEAARNLASSKPGERSRTFVEEVKQHETAITEILSPEQLHRLRQIALQRELYVRGAAAFRDPELAAALKLTPGQRDQLRALEPEICGRPDGPGRGPPGGARAGGPEQRLHGNGPPPHRDHPQDPPFGGPSPVRPLSQEAIDAIFAVFTDDQRAHWKELTGEPSKAAKSFRFPDRLGPPPPR